METKETGESGKSSASDKSKDKQMERIKKSLDNLMAMSTLQGIFQGSLKGSDGARYQHVDTVGFGYVEPGSFPCECNLAMTINDTAYIFTEEGMLQFRDMVNKGMDQFLEILHPAEPSPTLPCVVCGKETTRENAIQLTSGGWIHTDDCKA